MANKFSVTSPNDILNNPLNNSMSQFQYSFSKDERFKNPQSYCSSTFYEIPQQRDRRAASFGYGKKSDFTQTSVISPSPGSFELKSDFEQQRSVSKGRTFGLAREQMREFGHITLGPIKNPGPGTYDKQSGLSHIQYTMRPQTQDINGPVYLGGKTTYLSSPAPGAYEQVSAINKDGKWMFSKYQGSGATVFNPASSTRFPKDSKYAPGPGHYQPQNDLDSSGKYVLSQYQGDGTRAFPIANRSCFVDEVSGLSITPGPGNYRLTSEFGNYDHLDLYKSQDGFNNTQGSKYSKRNAASSQDFYQSSQE